MLSKEFLEVASRVLHKKLMNHTAVYATPTNCGTKELSGVHSCPDFESFVLGLVTWIRSGVGGNGRTHFVYYKPVDCGYEPADRWLTQAGFQKIGEFTNGNYHATRANGGLSQIWHLAITKEELSQILKFTVEDSEVNEKRWREAQTMVSRLNTLKNSAKSRVSSACGVRRAA